MKTDSSIRILSEAELKKLADVIDEVEKTTSAEIRLMVVKRSSVTGHVSFMLGSLLVFLTVLLSLSLHPTIFAGKHWWFSLAIVFGEYALAALLSHNSFVQRLFTSARDRHHQVWTRAEVEFHREGLGHTHLRSGVLLFVSLMERQSVVLADKALADKLPPHIWDHVVKIITQGARSGRWADKLEQALRECGQVLAQHFPPKVGQTNDLANSVILKD